MIFIKNKYARWYYNIITNSQSRILPPNVYVKRHHIIPKSLGGSNDHTNLATLTAREHFVCHLMLTKMVSGILQYKMLSAVARFRQAGKLQTRILTSWEYSKIRECAVLARTGVKHSRAAKQKIKDKHHDVSGGNNPRAKLFIITSPSGEVFHIYVGLKKFCVEQQIAYSSVLRILSKFEKWSKTFSALRIEVKGSGDLNHPNP